MTATIQVDLIEEVSPSKAYLSAAAGETVTGTPATAGYALYLDLTQSWRYTFSTSGLVGIFRVVIEDSDGATVAQGYVWIEADAGGTYIAGPDLPTLKAARRAQEIIDDWTNGGRLDLLLDSAITKIDTIDGIVDTILVDTATTIPGLVTTADTVIDSTYTLLQTVDGKIDIIDTNLDAVKIDTDATLPDLLYATNSLYTASSDSSIYARVGETRTVTVTCSKAVDALTLEVVFETSDKTDVGTIADGSITKSSLNATFDLTAGLTSSERNLRYTIKDTANDQTLASGRLFVTYDAQGD
jgi:hypothetical protein